MKRAALTVALNCVYSNSIYFTTLSLLLQPSIAAILLGL